MKLETLTDVTKYLDSIPDINSGGCGVAALAIYRWLKKQGKKSQIVFGYGGWNCGFSRNESLKNGTNETPSACSHAVVLYNGNYYDSNGESIDPPYSQNHSLPIWVVVKTLNTRDWNSEFDRRYIRQIAKDLNVNLSDIKINY